MTGLPEEDHFGKRIDEILTGREAGTVESWERIIRTGQPAAPLEVVNEIPDRPGEKSYWLERWYPVKIGEEVIGLAATFVDVTDRRRVQLFSRPCSSRCRPVYTWRKHPRES